VLGYDFLDEDSVDETHFLNLIKLSKSSKATANEKEIWHSILAFITTLNPNGGSVTTASIQKDELYSYFDLSKLDPFIQSVEKLRNDSEIILKPLKSSISDDTSEFHLKRSNLVLALTASVNTNTLTIVTGKPGVGKSALVKDSLADQFATASNFVFRADQFNQPHLANVFSNQSVNESIQDIFSCVALIPEKIIVIDSLEKLLEDPNSDNAFKQLLTLLKDYPEIKVIGTSRKYAIDLLIQKFGMDQKSLNIIEVPVFTDTDLQRVADQFPVLVHVLANTKIKRLLRCPKYLDFALRSLGRASEDYSNISITEFKDKLWNTLIKNVTNRQRGLPAKREDAFMNITLIRAKAMKLFIRPQGVDGEAVEMLENDQMIFQDKQSGNYAPSHDILEDWALVKYVSTNYEDFPKPQDLYQKIGNEPAIRRAFRLWIEDYLVDAPTKVNALITATLAQEGKETYWTDELLIAVFKSEDCASFFTAFETQLLANKAVLLNRCIHLIRTACKESLLTNTKTTLLLPVGSGWKELVGFVQKHIAKTNPIRGSVINLITDWEYRLLFSHGVLEKETTAVKNIIVHYFGQLEKGDEFWQKDANSNAKTELVTLLFNLSAVGKTEITDLVHRAIAKQKTANWRINSFYDLIINQCLSGWGNYTLVEMLPDLVIETAWQAWKLKPRKPITGIAKELVPFVSGRLRGDECWGIYDRHQFFPSGIYKIPIYDLLRSHPLKGAKFVVEFINYSVDFYVKANCEYKHELKEIEIELNDGVVVKQWAAFELWAAFRGSSVTHYCLESILVSLEKYLLETAALKTDVSRLNLVFLFNKLIRESNNVMICGVLSSVAMAYPEEVGEAMLPLLSVREFYKWDITRYIKEGSSLAPMDMKISIAQKTRWDSNQLEHRKKYLNGWRGFVVDYQFRIGTINTQMFAVIDKLKSKAAKDDIVWRKTLTEIDRREYRADPHEEQENTLVIQPGYDADVLAFMNAGIEQAEAQNAALNYSGLLLKAYEGKEPLSFENWGKCYDHYSIEENLNTMYDRPATLAAVGLRDFAAELTEEQKTWCLQKLVKIIILVIKDTFNESYEMNQEFNLMEKELSLKNLHLLMPHLATEDKESFVLILIYAMISPFHNYEMTAFASYLREVFFLEFPDEAKRAWIGMLHYAKYKKANPIIQHRMTDEEYQKEIKAEENYIATLATNKGLSIDIDELDLDTYNGYLLAKALLTIPYQVPDELYNRYLNKFIPLLTEDLKLEENHSYNRQVKERQVNSEIVIDIQFYLAEVLLKSDFSVSESILDLIINPLYSQDTRTHRFNRDDVFGFSNKIPGYIILKLDDELLKQPPSEFLESWVANFWVLWQHLFKRISNSGEQYLTQALFLDIDFNKERNNWKPLDYKQSFYFDMVRSLGNKNAKPIIKFMSTVGEKELLPAGLSLIADIVRTNPDEASALMNQAGEQLIKRLYDNHMPVVKKDGQLISDYVYLLDIMIGLGSSQAYFYRENVITYKMDD
jgi:hypothetical protein